VFIVQDVFDAINIKPPMTTNASSVQVQHRFQHGWNLRLMPNISRASCPGLPWTVSVQFTLKMCIAA